MRAICPWIVALTFSAGSVAAQIPALEPGVAFGSVVDYAGLAHRSDLAFNLFGLGMHVRGAHSQRLALGGYASTEWTWYLMPVAPGVSRRQGGLVSTFLGPEVTVQPLSWIDMRVAGLIGAVWRRDGVGESGGHFQSGFETGLTITPNQHGLRLRGLAFNVSYRRAALTTTELLGDGCPYAGPCPAPVPTSVRHSYRRWAMGLSYAFKR